MGKLFLSALGIGNYNPAEYRYNGKVVHTGKYVQTAILNSILKNWGGDIKILTTQAAYKTHWKPSNATTGLCGELQEACKFSKSIEAIKVEDGMTESEYWSIFKRLNSEIEEETEITFDITHSFRSLPLLTFIYINFARVAKSCKLARLLYGAYKPNKDENQPGLVEIIDFSRFFNVFEWTLATNSFLTTGDSASFKPLVQKIVQMDTIQNNRKNIVKEYINKIVQLTDSLKNPNLKYFLNDFETEAKKIEELSNKTANEELTNDERKTELEVLTPLFQVISKRVNSLKKQSSSQLDEFKITSWCLGHELIPQGFTFLQESLITKLIKMLKPEMIYKLPMRDGIRKALTRKDKQNNKIDTFDLTLPEMITDKFKKKFQSLTAHRDRINHANMKEEETKINLSKYRQDLKLSIKYFSDFFDEQNTHK